MHDFINSLSAGDWLASPILLAIWLALLAWCVPARWTAARIVVTSTLCVVVVCYLAWRLEHLIAAGTGWWMIWPWVFFALELVVSVVELWQLFLLARVRNRTPEADEYERRLTDGGHWPTIDVFIPTYNEPPDVLEVTLRHATSMDYPEGKVRVYLLDDGRWRSSDDSLSGEQQQQRRMALFRRRSAMESLCERYGATYLHRPEAKHAKAGNLQYGFDRSSGEYLILLDADFAVQPHFARRVVGLLVEQPHVGLVQTPQWFRNADAVMRNLGIEGLVPDDENFFMSVVQPCRDAYDNAFCVGTSCMVRRAAVEALGGFPHQTICEDLELSYALRLQGFQTVFLNEPLSFGLVPENVPTLINQRLRWCRGTIQHLFISTGPIFGKHRLLDRLFYLEPFFYWLSFLFLAAAVLAPIIYWWTGIAAIPLPAAGAVILLGRIVAREVAFYWLSFGKVPPVLIYVTRVLIVFPVAWTVLQALFRPFSGGFSVTEKGEQRTRTVVRTGMVALFASLAGIQLLGMAFGPVGVTAPAATEVQLLWTIWSVITLLMCTFICIELPIRGPGRAAPATTDLKSAFASLVRRVLLGPPRVTQSETP